MCDGSSVFDDSGSRNRDSGSSGDRDSGSSGDRDSASPEDRDSGLPPTDAMPAVSVDNAKIVVSAVTRLTPPEVGAGENHYGVREPWSVDGKRMKFFEWSVNGSTALPSYNFVVWAFVDDLRKAKTLDEYLRVRHNIHPNWEFAESVWWSPFAGEENIIYALHRPTQTLVRWNVDTETSETVVSYKPDDGSDVGQARLMGWTTDNKLICNLEEETRDRGAWEIDVAKHTRTFWLDAGGDGRFPLKSHGHSGFSPDRTLSFGGDTLETPSGTLNWPGLTYYTPPLRIDYITWRVSNAWFVATDFGADNAARWVTSGSGWLAAPHIDTFSVAQCRPDFSCDVFYTHQAPSEWDDLPANEHIWNWGNHLIPTQRRDGRQIVFIGTDGKYSEEDHDHRGVEPWGNPGLFLLDIDLVAR